MDDLKVRQAMGAVEGRMRVLVDEGEAQGRIAGAAAEAERIWGLGGVLAGEWQDEEGRLCCQSFLAELRKRAVPEAAGPAPVETRPALVPPSEDPWLLAKLAAHEEQLREEAKTAKGPQDRPLPEAVKPFDNSGGIDPERQRPGEFARADGDRE